MATLESLQDELIKILIEQVDQLTIMSKIELGDDVLDSIVNLNTQIETHKQKILKKKGHE